jgi:CRISPR-associated protein Csb2
VRPWGATTQRWLYESVRWASATPVVLDRFPKDPDQVEKEIRTSMRRVGLPDPVSVQVSNRPLLPGAADLRPSDLPRRAQGRLFCHIAVDFDRPVTGPLLVGAGRYLGVGLLAPQDRGPRD